MTTKQLIERLNELDPEGNCVINGLHFVERVEPYYDGFVSEPDPEAEGKHFPHKYRLRLGGDDKIELHMLWAHDWIESLFFMNEGKETGEWILPDEDETNRQRCQEYIKECTERAKEEYANHEEWLKKKENNNV